MPTDNKPMKGAHLILNEDVINFLADSIEDLREVWSDDVSDEEPKKIVLGLREAGWDAVQDNFGFKAIKSTTYPASTPALDTDELRVTVVLTKKGVLNIDIRPWGQYNN